MFREILDNPWLVTFVPAVVTVLGIGLWLRRGPFLTAYLSIFTIEIVADALHAGSWSPMQLLGSEWAGPIALVFVLLGDFRYFLLVERYAFRPDAKPRDATVPKAVLTAILFLLVAGFTELAARELLPPVFDSGEPSYLAWEVPFILLAVLLRAVILPRRLALAPRAVRTWLLQITNLEILTYGLWIVADVLTLTGHTWGFLLRTVPNLLYYVVFLLFVAWRAPPEVLD
jgi:hypothetical protein